MVKLATTKGRIFLVSLLPNFISYSHLLLISISRLDISCSTTISFSNSLRSKSLSVCDILELPRIASPSLFKPSTPVTVPNIFNISGLTPTIVRSKLPTKVPSPPFFF